MQYRAVTFQFNLIQHKTLKLVTNLTGSVCSGRELHQIQISEKGYYIKKSPFMLRSDSIELRQRTLSECVGNIVYSYTVFSS